MEHELSPKTENLIAPQARGSIPSGINDPAKRIACHRCHQCRRKIKGFAASCKNLRKDKPCVIKFCHTCLSNRYGEDALEVALLDDWSCPKCRGQCNCSVCMRNKGQAPRLLASSV